MAVHYTISLLSARYLPPPLLERLTQFEGLKVQFIQDEYRNVDAVTAAIRSLAIDVLVHVRARAGGGRDLRRPPPGVTRLFTPAGIRARRARRPRVARGGGAADRRRLPRSRAPGLARPARPREDRDRARRSSSTWPARASAATSPPVRTTGSTARTGTGSWRRAGQRSERRAAPRSSTSTAPRGARQGLHRTAARGDPGGDRARPDWPYEGTVVINTASPRLFEAAALRTAMILFRGTYARRGRAGTALHPDSRRTGRTSTEVVERAARQRVPRRARPIGPTTISSPRAGTRCAPWSRSSTPSFTERRAIVGGKPRTATAGRTPPKRIPDVAGPSRLRARHVGRPARATVVLLRLRPTRTFGGSARRLSASRTSRRICAG